MINTITASDITAFQEKILSWYEQHKRFLPWRTTKNPYHILVSEVMSQQTQVDRVIEYYDAWLRNLPDFYALAMVDTKKLLTLWSGLGYNSRALRLRELAGIIVKNYGGLLPDDYDELLKLPGIGPYTAGAVLAFSFNQEVPVIDTNIRRVLMHEFALPENTSLEDIRILAHRCIPKGKSRLWHNALMDYGALEITARKTGIKPLSTQGKFKGSDREVRGFITRHLTHHDAVKITDIIYAFPNKDVEGIIQKMVKENIIQKKGKSVILT